MAKISANGAHKIAEARRTRESGITGNLLEDVLVLTSDGRLLTRLVWPNNPSHSRSTGYTVAARAKKGVTLDRAWFARYCERRGYEVTA
jgi:hypothetical protein